MLTKLKRKLEWLESHNKNYTKQQYYTILECLEIIEEIELEKVVSSFVGDDHNEWIKLWRL